MLKKQQVASHTAHASRLNGDLAGRIFPGLEPSGVVGHPQRLRSRDECGHTVGLSGLASQIGEDTANTPKRILRMNRLYDRGNGLETSQMRCVWSLVVAQSVRVHDHASAPENSLEHRPWKRVNSCRISQDSMPPRPRYYVVGRWYYLDSLWFSLAPGRYSTVMAYFFWNLLRLSRSVMRLRIFL